MSDPNGNNNNNGGKIQPFQKNNYFYGKLMSVRDFKTEQEYFDSKRHLLSRLIFKPGIACGLDYRLGQSGEPDKIKVFQDVDKKIKIEISTGGAALDSNGCEIIVPDNSIKVIHKESGGDYVPLTYDDITGNLYLYLKYTQCLAELVPAISDVSSCEEKCCNNRIIEDFLVIAFLTPPANDPTPCPNLYETPTSDMVLENIKNWTDESLREECPVPEDPMVFLAAVDKDLKVIPGETVKYRVYVHNNKLLAKFLTCHIADPIHFEKGGFYETKEISLKLKEKWEYDHNFGRFPAVDAYQKVFSKPQKKKKFTFFYEDEFKEIAKFLGKTEAEIKKDADLLQNLSKRDDAIPIFDFETRFNKCFEKLQKEFEVYATEKVMKRNHPYGIAMKKVYFIEQPVVGEFYWRKITGCSAAPDLEIRVDENRVTVINLEKTGTGTFKLILQA